MIPQGKGFFIWRIDLTEGGSPDAIARLAHDGGFNHLFLHIHDGYLPENAPSLGGRWLDDYVAALKSAGVSVWGWGAVYATSWAAGADIAIRRVQELELDGYIVDAEAAMKGFSLQAEQLMTRLRAGLGESVPIGLSSYRYPHYHPTLPWVPLRAKMSFDMPQVYWQSAHNPVQQLESSLREFAAMYPSLPYIPTGAAYKVGGWAPTRDDVLAFLDAAKNIYKFGGVNFWVWYQCRRDLPDVWDAIYNYRWPIETVPEPLTMEQKVERLWQEAALHGWDLGA